MVEQEKNWEKEKARLVAELDEARRENERLREAGKPFRRTRALARGVVGRGRRTVVGVTRWWRRRGTKAPRTRAEKRLVAKLAKAQKENERHRAERRFAGGFLGWVLAGPDLARSFQQWRKAKTVTDPLPDEETAQLFAAVVRRVFVVGVVGLVVASIPIFLLWQQNKKLDAQNALIFDQNQFFQHQIGQTQEQLNQDRDDTYRVRKAELLQIIYAKKEGCEDSEAEPGRCLVVQEQPVRNQAIRALVEIENGRGKRIDLAFADLTDADLARTDLANANFINANLRDADLRGADLSNANLVFADLRLADLKGTNLKEANLTDAKLGNSFLADTNLALAKLFSTDLTRAQLTGADLTGADLRGTDLRGTDLTNADLTDAKLREAENLPDISLTIGNSATQLPPNTPRPEHWDRPIAEQSKIVLELINAEPPNS